MYADKAILRKGKIARFRNLYRVCFEPFSVWAFWFVIFGCACFIWAFWFVIFGCAFSSLGVLVCDFGGGTFSSLGILGLGLGLDFVPFPLRPFACAARGRGRSIVNAPYNPRTLFREGLNNCRFLDNSISDA